jgi:hypothetical protein
MEAGDGAVSSSMEAGDDRVDSQAQGVGAQTGMSVAHHRKGVRQDLGNKSVVPPGGKGTLVR